MKPQEQIDILAIRCLTKSLNDLISACTDSLVNPRKPEKIDIIKAKRMLPPGYLHSMIKSIKEDSA